MSLEVQGVLEETLPETLSERCLGRVTRCVQTAVQSDEKKGKKT
jgi:hypothetical protein